MKYASAERAQWQEIAQQIDATYSRYIARLTAVIQYHRFLHDEAEALLIAAQQRLTGARAMAGVSPGQTAHQIHGALDIADKRPDLLLEDQRPSIEFSQQVDLQKSIRSAVAEFTWRNTSSQPAAEKYRAAVLQFEFSSRADLKVFALSVPLCELAPLEGLNWSLLAESRAEVVIPFRMGSAVVSAKPGSMFQGLREVRFLEQVHILASSRDFPAPAVRVREAQRGLQPNTFHFTTDGSAPVTIHWSVPSVLAPHVSPPPISAQRVGFVQSSPVPPLEPMTSGAQHASADDYIVVFPGATGVDPVYIVFGNRGG